MTGMIYPLTMVVILVLSASRNAYWNAKQGNSHDLCCMDVRVQVLFRVKIVNVNAIADLVVIVMRAVDMISSTCIQSCNIDQLNSTLKFL